jgi:drug/metabolite transporter (DMT)-like permease
MVLALVAAALFGAATPLSKMLLGTINPFMLAGLLYLGAGISLAPKAIHGGIFRKLRTLNAKNYRYILGSMICGGIIGPVFLLLGLKAAKSASVSLWLNLELVATTLLGHFLFKDRATRASALAAIGILAAAALLSWEGGSTSIVGGLLVAVACLAWGFDNHFSALIDGLKAEESTFLKGIAAGMVNGAIGIAVAGGISLPLPSLAASLAIGAFSYGLSIVLYISAAQGLGASRAQLFFSSSPLFGLLLAALVLRESLSLAQGAALIIMVLSYAFLFSERHEHRHIHESVKHTHWHRHDEDHHLHQHSKISSLAKLFGHSHEHVHEVSKHAHVHVSDIHHRHSHK